MKKVINSPKAPKAIGPYSQAIEVNGMIYISGQLPVDVNTGKFAEGGIQEQTEQSLKNIGYILEAAGCTYDNVVKTMTLKRLKLRFARAEPFRNVQKAHNA